MDKTTKNYIKIALAACLWGTLGYFGTRLKEHGLSSEMIAFARLFSGLLILTVFFAIKNPQVLKIDKKGLISCAVLGITSQGIFNLAYFTSMRIIGAFTSAVLLYTSIIFMFFLGTFLYKEKPTRKKIIAVCICMAGCVLGATGGDFSTLDTTIFGVLAGLLAAFTYALMPVLSKSASRDYNPFTVIIYSFLFGMLFLMPFAKPWVWLQQGLKASSFGMIFLFGFFASCIPYGLYIPSLHNVQISKVGVISSVELIVSIIISGFVLKENVGLGHVAGAALIVSSIVYMNTNFEGPKKASKKS